MSLQFIFTQDSFYPDKTDEILTDSEEKLKNSFMSDRYKSIFNLSFTELGKYESAALSYLRSISESFLNSLTAMLELGLLKEEFEI